jgi:ribosomal protein S18 acetylase RimI-like enzyme
MPKSSIVIKELESKDCERAAAFAARMIRLEARSDHKSHYSKALLKDLIKNSRRTIFSAPRDSDNFCVIATKDKRITGIALGRTLGGVGRVDWIAVAPEQRRGGIGKRLAHAVEASMLEKGCHKITLYISESHIPAIGLFLKWGMIPEGMLKRHEWGNDYTVMSKWLRTKG